mmetsp:Transcript_35084/g.82101  ORF Transcript_35084/g.82101 Transcript_35084/m.82101 type:complete len:234 (-) Transcript_35084:222-923(-)
MTCAAHSAASSLYMLREVYTAHAIGDGQAERDGPFVDSLRRVRAPERLRHVTQDAQKPRASESEQRRGWAGPWRDRSPTAAMHLWRLGIAPLVAHSGSGANTACRFGEREQASELHGLHPHHVEDRLRRLIHGSDLPYRDAQQTLRRPSRGPNGRPAERAKLKVLRARRAHAGPRHLPCCQLRMPATCSPRHLPDLEGEFLRLQHALSAKHASKCAWLAGINQMHCSAAGECE